MCGCPSPILFSSIAEKRNVVFCMFLCSQRDGNRPDDTSGGGEGGRRSSRWRRRWNRLFSTTVVRTFRVSRSERVPSPPVFSGTEAFLDVRFITASRAGRSVIGVSEPSCFGLQMSFLLLSAADTSEETFIFAEIPLSVASLRVSTASRCGTLSVRLGKIRKHGRNAEKGGAPSCAIAWRPYTILR